jgi:RNA polymerase sigma-70 factor (ECF subfamily)
MELYSDAYYIQRIQAGDVAAFACLIDKYSRPIHSLILKIVNNREDAEELAQDVFMKVFRHLESFKGDSSFSTWIYRIAYNMAISETRKRKYEFATIEDAFVDKDSAFESEASLLLWETDKEEQLKQLDMALNKLPPGERALILLFYMEEKSVEEIVTITGMSASNVKTKLHRIRKKVFVLLKETENN